MADANIQFINITPTVGTTASTNQAPGGKAVPHVGGTVKGNLYASRRKKPTVAPK